MPILRKPNEIKLMRKSGRLAAEALEYAISLVKEGVSTGEIDESVADFVKTRGGKCTAFQYKGFPGSICTSVNDVICHGIPSRAEVLKNGDIINLDVAVTLNGWIGDCSRTIPVGDVSETHQKVINASQDALALAMMAVGHKEDLSNIGRAVETIVIPRGLSVAYAFLGHGVGKSFHEKPDVWHVYNPRVGGKMIEGMTFTIEPAVNAGTPDYILMSDGWTCRTKDGKPSAQTEHTLGVQKGKGLIVFTENDSCPVLSKFRKLGGVLL
jgi:methionyl aminopeptidase